MKSGQFFFFFLNLQRKTNLIGTMFEKYIDRRAFKMLLRACKEAENIFMESVHIWYPHFYSLCLNRRLMFYSTREAI